ncbi:MAG TPA: protein-L-isoaspartate O-methyltransferase [Stellaceae bacterium]|nr:protein-L-isoaspartate O-methyltransferase [Stellaceae bacterium]
MIDYAAARLNMVDGQLRTNGVVDPALVAAFLAVPRERFVPEPLRGTAYVDEDLPLGNGRYLMEPLVLARLIQLAEPGRDARVLCVGAGPGYDAAILAHVVGAVVALESDPALAATARRLLRELGYSKASVIEGSLEEGHTAGAPYDAILFGGAIAEVPDAIARQLAETGRIAAVVRADGRVSQVTVMTRVGTVLSRRPVFDAANHPLPGFASQPAFVF